MMVLMLKDKGKSDQREAEFEAVTTHERRVARAQRLHGQGITAAGGQSSKVGSGNSSSSLVAVSINSDGSHEMSQSSYTDDAYNFQPQVSPFVPEVDNVGSALPSLISYPPPNAGAKPDGFVCDICGKDFPMASKLKYYSPPFG